MKRVDILILRVLCVVVVVLFHTVARYGCNPLIGSPAPIWIKSFLRIAIWVAVPMFFFISGLLFSSQLRRGRYNSWSSVCYEKAKRLILPYVVFSILIMLSSGVFSFTGIIRGGFWHLWFLPTLFFCFVALYPVLRISNHIGFEIVVLILLFAVSFIKIPIEYSFMGYDGMLRWGFYFVLGYIIGNHEEKLQFIMSKYHIWILLLLIWIINNVFTYTPYMTVTWNNAISVGCGIMSIFYLIGKIKIGGGIKRFVEIFSSMSMGIYILHYWVLVYTTSSTAFRLLGVFEPVSDFHIICTILLITIVTILISFYITKLLKSFRLTKLIIG